ncbi:MAG: DUF1700 domain-containing protein [Clostridia bacterium]|nr:DUF1700 domain-containing protein [Clostridia bacterium]
MTRLEFMIALEKALEGIPRETADEALAYYSEILSDRIEEGADEAEAVASVGTVEEIRDSILREMPAGKRAEETGRPCRRVSAAAIVLLILSLPVTLPLAAASGALILTLFILLMVMIVAVWAAEAGLIAGGIGTVALGAAQLIRGHFPQMLFCFGGTLICFALAVLLFSVIRSVTRFLFLAGKRALGLIGRVFRKRRKGK